MVTKDRSPAPKAGFSVAGSLGMPVLLAMLRDTWERAYAVRLDNEGHVRALDTRTLWIAGDTATLTPLSQERAMALAMWAMRRGGMYQAMGLIASVDYVTEDPAILALWCALEVGATCDPVIMGPTFRTMAGITAARLVVAEWERLAGGGEPEPVSQGIAVALLAHEERWVRVAALAHMGWRRARCSARRK